MIHKIKKGLPRTALELLAVKNMNYPKVTVLQAVSFPTHMKKNLISLAKMVNYPRFKKHCLLELKGLQKHPHGHYFLLLFHISQFHYKNLHCLYQNFLDFLS